MYKNISLISAPTIFVEDDMMEVAAAKGCLAPLGNVEGEQAL